jgi:signal peptidase I
VNKPILEQIPVQDLTLPNAVLRELMQAALERDVPFRFRALGSSMTPFIREGDVVVVHPLHSRKPAPGQVVAFIHPANGSVLVHRVVRRQGSIYQIQGDNMPGQTDGSVPEENILGRVTQVKRNEHGIWFGRGITGVWIAALSRFGLLHPIVSGLRKVIGRRATHRS